jgi:hypothetical protein
VTTGVRPGKGNPIQGLNRDQIFPDLICLFCFFFGEVTLTPCSGVLEEKLPGVPLFFCKFAMFPPLPLSAGCLP